MLSKLDPPDKLLYRFLLDQVKIELNIKTANKALGLLNALLVHTRFGVFILILRKQSDNNNSMYNYVRVFMYLC